MHCIQSMREGVCDSCKPQMLRLAGCASKLHSVLCMVACKQRAHVLLTHVQLAELELGVGCCRTSRHSGVLLQLHCCAACDSMNFNGCAVRDKRWLFRVHGTTATKVSHIVPTSFLLRGGLCNRVAGCFLVAACMLSSCCLHAACIITELLL